MKLADQLDRIQRIAVNIGLSRELSADDQHYIALSLLQISNGEDVNDAFGLESTQGVRRKDHSPKAISFKENRDALVVANIKHRIANVAHGGLGQTLEEAIGSLGENGHFTYKLTEETLRTIWRDRKKAQKKIKLSKDSLSEVKP